MPGGPGAAPWQGQQQMPGAAPMPMGAQPPWYQPDALGAPPPGAYQQQQPFGPQGMMPGQQMPPGIPPGGQSWVQNQGQQRQMPPPGSQMSVLNMAPQQRGPVAAPLSGQSMIGPDGQQMGPGEGAVSWMQNPGQQIPGMPAQGMQLGPNQMMGPGGMPVSQMGQQIAAPGQAARSLMDGTVQAPGMGGHSMMGGQQVQAPGMGAQSMMTGEHVQAPNMGAQSMLSSEWVVAPGQIAQSMIDGSIQAPGQAARSMMDGSIQAPGLAAQSMLDGSIQAPGDAAVSMMDGSIQAPGQAAQSVLQAEGPRGEHPDGGVMTPEQTACATEEEARAAKADPTLVTDEKKSKADPTLVTDEKKGDGKEPLWTGAKEDEELVDPDADRPDFGGAADEEGASDAAAAARAEAFKFERKKPLDPAYVTAGLMAFALIACGAVVWTQRATLMQWWPGFAALYEKTGMAPKNPGDGLRLAQSGMRLQRVGGVETLVVKGYISNISQASRPVPGLRLQLTDAKNEVVQEITSAAPKTTLDAGASVDYELRLELPDMGKAKNVIVSWQG